MMSGSVVRDVWKRGANFGRKCLGATAIGVTAMLGCGQAESEAGSAGTADSDGAAGTDGAAGAAGTAGAASRAQSPGHLILPVVLSYTNWDYHLAQWLPNHPQYEMVELMLNDLADDPPATWVFFTEREAPKHQTHFANSAELAGFLSGSSSDDTRTVHHVPIEVELNEYEDGQLEFGVHLTTPEGEEVTWVFSTTGPPTNDHAPGLIDQSGHDLHGGILVMYSATAVLADASTSLAIGDEQYPVQVWEALSEPPYFTAYYGACSKGLALGYLPSTRGTSELLARPQELRPGESWKYILQSEGESFREYDWEIEQRQDDRLTIRGGELTVLAELIEDRLQIQRIRLDDDGGYLALHFSPPLPDLDHLESGATARVRFGIDVDKHVDEFTGELSVQEEDGRVKLLLAPEEPEWAATSPLHVVLDIAPDRYEYASETIPD